METTVMPDQYVLIDKLEIHAPGDLTRQSADVAWRTGMSPA